MRATILTLHLRKSWRTDVHPEVLLIIDLAVPSGGLRSVNEFKLTLSIIIGLE